ncbi:DUF6705 family protein [Chryseobacterium culicis]|uniref:DUF6705 domain-containing protein n=1 Tax=Chryseobacterium culicis TaxID=680127 RepID=A0A2S9CMW5_CHRCI|nr:DUF6705 family protein [Chryseobacterium culicis]PRB81852.1 hypothetical protein CQ022_19480 [Chryseobacterium culicis]PRB88507.1 hypothetical protein CQ033_18385 [Chryseobacterium culicis]
MKNIFFIILTIFTANLNAQTVSLETIAQCQNNLETCPPYTSVKDINGHLNKYVGTWKGTHEGKNYEINIIKKENVPTEFSNTKWDMLIGRFKITNSNGTVLFNNFNKSDNDASLGYNFQKDLKLYLMTFSGGKLGCIDIGFVYIGIKPEAPNKMTINFRPDYDIVTQDCSNFQTTMPTNQVIHLTKQ